MSTRDTTAMARRESGNGNGRAAYRDSGMDMLERRLPYDLESEKSLIGSIMLSTEAFDLVRGIVREEDFFDEANRTLYRTMLGMVDAGEAIDVVLLVNRLKASGCYEAVGGASYIFKTSESVPNPDHAVYYARIVADKAKLRGIIAASTETLRDAYAEMEQSSEILSRAEDRLFTLRDDRTIKQARPIHEILHDTLDQIDRGIRGEETVAIATGFTDLDRILAGGFRPGELVIVAARPSMGKSSLAADFTCSIATDRSVAFFSLEMTDTNLCERMLSAIGQVDGIRLRNRTINETERTRLTEAAGNLSQRHICIDDNSHMRVGDIAASLRTIEQRAGRRVEMIVVDYLQFVTPDDQKLTREQQVANIGRRLKTLAKEQQIPVVAVCAVSRKNEDGSDKRPKLSMLRESGSLEFEADIVLGIHREDYYRRGEERHEVEGLAEVLVLKQRNGPTGEIELRWDAAHTRFQNLAPERLQQFEDYTEQAGLF